MPSAEVQKPKRNLEELPAVVAVRKQASLEKMVKGSGIQPEEISALADMAKVWIDLKDQKWDLEGKERIFFDEMAIGGIFIVLMPLIFVVDGSVETNDYLPLAVFILIGLGLLVHGGRSYLHNTRREVEVKTELTQVVKDIDAVIETNSLQETVEEFGFSSTLDTILMLETNTELEKDKPKNTEIEDELVDFPGNADAAYRDGA